MLISKCISQNDIEFLIFCVATNYNYRILSLSRQFDNRELSNYRR